MYVLISQCGKCHIWHSLRVWPNSSNAYYSMCRSRKPWFLSWTLQGMCPVEGRLGVFFGEVAFSQNKKKKATVRAAEELTEAKSTTEMKLMQCIGLYTCSLIFGLRGCTLAKNDKKMLTVRFCFALISDTVQALLIFLSMHGSLL